MGLWQKMREAAGVVPKQEIANQLTGPMELEAALREMVGDARSGAGVVVTSTRAARLAAVGSCIRVLADDIAALPLILYREDQTGQKIKDKTNPLYSILKSRPNEWQTSFEFRQFMQRCKLLRGNGYAYKVTGFGGRIVELIPLHPNSVAPKQDSSTLEVTYEYTRKDGRRVILKQNEVLHLRGPSDDGLIGLNTVAHYRETIGDGIAMRDHGSRFFANGARPSATLEAEGKIGPEDKKAMREDFETLYSGIENSGRVAVLDQGVKYNQLSMSMEDAEYLDSRKFNRTEICGIFGVPPHKIGDLEKATFSNIEHQSLEYVNSSLMPHLVAWEQAIERDLISDPENFCKFNVDALLRGDFKSRQEGLAIQRRNGVINPNEWRDTEDMNRRADAGGEGYIIESNMQPDDGSFRGIKSKPEASNAPTE